VAVNVSVRGALCSQPSLFLRYLHLLLPRFKGPADPSCWRPSTYYSEQDRTPIHTVGSGGFFPWSPPTSRLGPNVRSKVAGSSIEIEKKIFGGILSPYRCLLSRHIPSPCARPRSLARPCGQFFKLLSIWQGTHLGSILPRRGTTACCASALGNPSLHGT
jgi:hypothetical protein